MNKIIIIILSFLLFLTRSLFNLVVFLRRQLWKYDLMKHEIINSVCPKDIYIEGSNGYVTLTATHLRKKYVRYKIKFDDGRELICADEHLLATQFGYNVYAKNLRIGYPILAKDKVIKVKSIKKLKTTAHMFDTVVASPDKLYFTNDILSHNSITTAIFITWYLLTNKERNVMCVSENGDKVEELMDKIDKVMRNLPFFMKLGVITDNMFTKVWDNGCKLKAQKTTENTGASFTIHVLYADEFALVNERFLNEFYRTVYPTLSSSEISKMIITSTPRGLNKFYEIYQGAIEGRNEFNPIRTDWYEVPLNDKKGNPLRDKDGIIFRGEEWKAKQIANLGSEEDFNQEFGNQFLAGNKLLFSSATLKRLKKFQVEFVHRDIEVLDDMEIQYQGVLKFHPSFDLDNLYNDTCRFCSSTDLADGVESDYSVTSFFQILPMSKSEIDALQYYTDEKDFFKCVQIALLRSNVLSIEEYAKLFYHCITDVFKHENIKGVLEMNHEGNLFVKNVVTIYGEHNNVEEEHFFVKFNKNYKNSESENYATGIVMNDDLKELSCKLLKTKAKNSQLIPTEKTTIEESIGYSRNKKGVYQGQGRNDDCVCTCRNHTLYFDTNDYLDQIEELADFVPKDFFREVASKMGKHFNDDDDDNSLDILA